MSLFCLRRYSDSLRLRIMRPLALPFVPQRSVNIFSSFLSNDKPVLPSLPLSDSDRIQSNPKPLQPIFCNVEIGLSHCRVIGFDYDHTIAPYTIQVSYYIYEKVRDALIDMGYPKELRKLEYDKDFAVRGLYYDLHRGFFLKLDNTGRIELGSVFFGRRRLTKAEVLESYGSFLINRDTMKRLKCMADLFCLSETCILADVIQTFNDLGIRFDATYIYMDVSKALNHVHVKLLHPEITGNLNSYLQKQSMDEALFKKFINDGRSLFLLTNNSYVFVNEGMKYMIGTHWREYFDVIVTEADKPKWYMSDRPFREVDPSTGDSRPNWHAVQRFKRGFVYSGGNMKEFMRITGWSSGNVLYIGDHLHSDLVEPHVISGWRTCAIIRELGRDVAILQSKKYIDMMRELDAIEDRIRTLQMSGALDRSDVWNGGTSLSETSNGFMLFKLKLERRKLRNAIRGEFNGNFGSAFSTIYSPTLFGAQITEYSCLYTSSVKNFLAYPSDYVFYPLRRRMPHELPPSSNNLDAIEKMEYL